MPNDFLKTPTTNDIVLTVNQRLSAYLQNEYASEKAKETTIWQTPDILPFNSWLQRCWQTHMLSAQTNLPLLLNPQQEQVLWEQIICQSPQAEQLISISATAKQARQAWQLVQQWQIDYRQSLFSQTEDGLAWQQWANTFAQTCKNKHWLDSAHLLEKLIEIIKNQQLELPERIFLVGFDEINLQQQRLLDLLENHGCTIIKVIPQQIHCPSPTNERGAMAIAINNPETELQTMAHWAQQTKQNGNQRIACVIPNLNEIRSQVSHIFTECFAPTTQIPGQADDALPFNISAGITLTSFPLIATALQILHLSALTSLTNISTLLLSPYLSGAEQEQFTRAQLDVQLRANSESQCLLQQITVAAKKHHCPLFATLIKNLLTHITQTRGQASPSHWAAHFTEGLKQAGWPGDRTLNSTEYQLYQRWKALLTEFCQLDAVLPAIDYKTACHQLQQLASTTLFQPQTKYPAPIQILGMLETAGLFFDQVWIMGLHDQAWPPAPKPNPFIPLTLQRALAMPHASSERELTFCREVTQRLLSSAPEVICSYPQQTADQHLRISALIRHLPTMTMADLALPTLTSLPSLTALIQQSRQLETFQDDYGPAVTATESLSAGSHIFKLQAACPFRAFAELRLNAVAIASPELGLPPRERGNLLHAALETLWNQLQSHAQLIAYTEAELDNLIEITLNDTFVKFIQKYPLTFKQQFIQLEKQRLFALLQQWLEREKQRPAFTVVALEQGGEYRLANIPLKLRVDRIDRLADNTHLIIDYKTSRNVTCKSWLSDRPDEPQLPIYCLTSTVPIQGIAFAQLRSNQLQWVGLSAEATHIKGITALEDSKEADIPENWEALQQYWRQVLEMLGAEFLQGNAKVDPKKGEQTCRYCDLGILCRVKEKF